MSKDVNSYGTKDFTCLQSMLTQIVIFWPWGQWYAGCPLWVGLKMRLKAHSQPRPWRYLPGGIMMGQILKEL